MRSTRIEELEAVIIQNRTISMDQLCADFGISKSTLRRDLAELVKRGRIRKIYGGVEAAPQGKLVSFMERATTAAGAKQQIGKAAAGLVRDGDIIFLDSGTTTLYMADEIGKRKNLTVLTNNIEVILRMLPYEDVQVIALSGMLNRKTFSFTGAEAAEALQRYNISKAFLACTGISAESGATNSSSSESEVKRMAVARSRNVYLLADSNKFNVVSLITYCNLADIDVLITNQAPPPAIAAALKKAGARVLLAGE